MNRWKKGKTRTIMPVRVGTHPKDETSYNSGDRVTDSSKLGTEHGSYTKQWELSTTESDLRLL